MNLLNLDDNVLVMCFHFLDLVGVINLSQCNNYLFDLAKIPNILYCITRHGRGFSEEMIDKFLKDFRYNTNDNDDDKNENKIFRFWGVKS